MTSRFDALALVPSSSTLLDDEGEMFGRHPRQRVEQAALGGVPAVEERAESFSVAHWSTSATLMMDAAGSS